MENKILKKLIIVMMIITLIAADFLFLGKSIVSYAASLDIFTNNENIEFYAYFKDAEGNTVLNLEENINKEDLKLYAEIAVKNEGYFNGTIEINDSNFYVKNEILSPVISKIEGNKITLNQINAGTTVEVELAIEAKKEEQIKIEQLSQATKVKLTGTYMEKSYKGIEIEAEKTVNLNLVVDKTNTVAEVSNEIVTNKVYSVNGTNKRVVQMLLKSKITNNSYPVKQTIITAQIPETQKEKLESIQISAIRTGATNGQENNVTKAQWKAETGEGIEKVEIKIENVGETVSWKKGVEDEYIITYIYSEETDVSSIELNTKTEIEVYNEETKLSKETKILVGTGELSNIIVSEVKLDNTETYKGQLYENAKMGEEEIQKEVPFKSTTKMIIRATGIAENVSIKEEKDVFVTTGEELAANTRYVKTYINKEKMQDLLGETGTIQIKSTGGNYTLTKETVADENGNIVIEYEGIVNEIEIITNGPVKEGILELDHEKAIMGNEYDTAQIKTITGLKSKTTLTALVGETKIVENTAEAQKELKETYSKAELIVNKENLTTMATNNEVILGVKFLTYGLQYDLYKNPTIKIQLPESVEAIKVSSINKLYGDEFTVPTAEYYKASKQIEIALAGEQTKYAESDVKQLYLQIKLDITLDKTVASKTDKITMTYTNENAVQYEGNGTVEKQIGIIAPSGIIAMNDITSHDISTIAGISENKQITKINKDTAGGTSVEFKTAIINNTGSNLSNVKILGNFPTDGEFVKGSETITNTFTTSANAINAENATIYYSSNANATTDVSDTNNGWTQNIGEVTNPKVYLIEIGNMNVEQNFTATYTVKLPQTLEYNLLSYAGYKVMYDGDTAGTQTVESALVGISTEEGQNVRPEDVKMETSITATVGNDTINSGDAVKAGEVIKYKATVKNTGDRTLSNVTLKGLVPEGTVVVVPEENYEYSGVSYYEEKTDLKEYSQTINLEAGKEYSIEYEVRVNMNVANGTEISNKAIAICGDSQVESSEFKNTISESKIRVTLKNIYGKQNIRVPGNNEIYVIFVENLGNETENVDVKMLMSGQDIRFVTDGENKIEYNTDEKTLKLGEIASGETKSFDVTTTISEDATGVTMVVNATDSKGNTYRSNKDIQVVEQSSAEIMLSTPNNGAYINVGDEVLYNLEVKNTSSIPQNIDIVDNIPQELEVIEISVNGQVQMQSLDFDREDTFVEKISNNINYAIEVGAGEKAKVTIKTLVNEPEAEFDLKTIKNSAQAVIKNVVKATSTEVTHIIQGSIGSDMKNIISGTAWLDKNQNGQKDDEEQVLSDIVVRVLDVTTNQIALDKEGNVLETKTDSEGLYTFSKVGNGEYIILFEYDTTKYEPTDYMKEGISEETNSDAVEREVAIEGQTVGNAATDIIEVLENTFNINIGLKENLKYDLELGKYISKIIVQNKKGTKTYEYTDEDATFKKVEINSKQVEGSVVVLEYTIKVKNTGEMAGYVTNIRDYLPSGLTFSSELNPDWYLSGQDLYTKSLANIKIEPGETKELKLTLTKTMTSNNVGLINNRAEIAETYNEYGKLDIDSTVNNQANGEDDLGSADVIIGISTGIRVIAYTMLIMLNTGLIALAIYLIFKKNKRAN